jgi:lysyl-tRNA synthetase class 2
MAETRLAEIRKIRIKKLNRLRSLGINPYPSKFSRKFIPVSRALTRHHKQVSVVGRIRRYREHGQIVFMDLADATGQIQLLFQENLLAQSYPLLKLLDIGDFLGVTGKVITTQAGQVTVDVSYFEILSKSLRPLPDDWYGLKEVEERYRKRYLDLLLNLDVKKRFVLRTQIVGATRQYLDKLGFMEVETPTLQSLYGGANAKPFKTHLNALDSNMYLRIADELYLKRLVIGGFDKVYEICKDFRNEGFDQTHHPEFTMIEYYQAYADYHQVMDVTEGLFKYLSKEILKSDKIRVGEQQIDISSKWPRIKMVDVIKEKLNLDVLDASVSDLAAYCKKSNIPLLGGESKGQLIFAIFEHRVTDLLIEPVWILDYPRDVSPLSKATENDPVWVERFEGYVGGKEICDGWSELTDPEEQRTRFETDVKAVRSDLEEAQQVDEDFLEAMEYGMPPIGGIGIGIDRLTMFFTNTWSIKEVILFPLLRPEK